MTKASTSISKITAQPFFGRNPVTNTMVRKLLDEYAIENNKHWCCDNIIFCARGHTPLEAQEALQEAMDGLFHSKRHYVNRKVRA